MSNLFNLPSFRLWSHWATAMVSLRVPDAAWVLPCPPRIDHGALHWRDIGARRWLFNSDMDQDASYTMLYDVIRSYVVLGQCAAVAMRKSTHWVALAALDELKFGHDLVINYRTIDTAAPWRNHIQQKRRKELRKGVRCSHPSRADSEQESGHRWP